MRCNQNLFAENYINAEDYQGQSVAERINSEILKASSLLIEFNHVTEDERHLFISGDIHQNVPGLFKIFERSAAF